jgi:hypothetical protein
MESRGLTFEEIRDAVFESDCVLFVVSPSALQSEYVCSEWEHALRFGKAVLPILRLSDISHLPKALAKFHCPDLRESVPYEKAFQDLVRGEVDPG